MERAASDLGYVPHLGARALAIQATETLGLLGPSANDGFFGEVASGLEERALEEGFATLLATSHRDADRERRMLELFVGKRVDGIVIVSATGMPSEWFPRGTSSVPIVLVDWDTSLPSELAEMARGAPVDQVLRRVARAVGTTPFTHLRIDDLEGAIRATEHLIALGHRRIAFAGLHPIRPALLRLLGVRIALERALLPPPVVIACKPSLEAGERAGLEILRRAPRPTAVVSFDDTTAIGVIRAVHASGLAVPGDVSVTGFDDLDVAAFLEPPLTTVAQPAHALGRASVELIIGQLRGVPAHVASLLPGKIVVRSSTGPPSG